VFSIKSKIYGEKNKQTIIVFGGWGIKEWQLFPLGHLLNSYDFKAIILTWDSNILTPDPKLTLKRFQELERYTLELIAKLPKKERSHLSLFGISQGTFPTLMVANNLPSIDRIILNLSGANFADIIWSWDKVIPNFKNKILEKNLDLPKLKKIWKLLSPIYNLGDIHTSKILMFLSQKDELIPFSEQELLLEAIKKNGLDVEAIVNTRHNHFKSGLINLLRFWIYINFLKKPVPTKRLVKQK